MERKNAWLSYSAAEKKKVLALSEDYKVYMTAAKTERESVTEAIKLAEEKGYRNLEELVKKNIKVKTGDKIYANCIGKALALFMIGTEPIAAGMNILGAHVDSPRLDLKPNPLYEDTDYALLDTHYYGGVKKYQWVAMPLAIHGVVVKKDSTVLNICIGEKESDPVFCISDLLPHLGKDQMSKKASEVIEGEALDVIIGSEPLKTKDEKQKDLVKANILKILKSEYKFEEEDFLSAELEVVPAGPARDMGLDRSMVLCYGQDDRICGYTSLRALLDTETTAKTAVCLLTDKEEVGSNGLSGMHSRFFENAVAEIMELAGEFSDLNLRRCFANSCMLSSDVSAGFDVGFPGAFEKKNAAYLGRGVSFNKYTGRGGKGGSNDASAEYIAKIRKIMDDNKVLVQISELGKVDQGGGGTIAFILANLGMQVIDCGIPVLSMHAPFEVSSKADIYEAVKCYKAFIKEA